MHGETEQVRNMEKNLYLIFTGGSGNRGCEAIVRGTVELMKDYPGEITVFTAQYDEEIASGLTDTVRCLPLSGKHRKCSGFVRHVLCWLSYHFGTGRLQIRLIYEKIWKHIKKEDAYMVIGGDVYCYGKPYMYYHLNRILKNNRKILWGCSIEPQSIDAQMKADLASYDLICARESITYEGLLAAGLEKNTILAPDPAFVLPPQQLPLPEGFAEGNTVGINVSPMIQDHDQTGTLVMENYVELIRDILENTAYQIALIPHVIWQTSDDRKPLEALYRRFRDTGRVVLLEGLPAQQIKSYISRCRLFVAARTHASIAAYSSCVPTLVMGYSVKARGIAMDLFGTYENYVLPVQGLQTGEDLKKAFRWISSRETQIRDHLRQIMPDYIRRVQDGVTQVREVLKEGKK